jgi:hypothetical protein
VAVIAEALRNEVLDRLFTLKTFSADWPERRAFFLNELGPEPGQSDVLALGDHLSEAFQIKKNMGRAQSALAGAGDTWEALVVWYLNLCLVGTSAVCVRPTHAPAPIRDALSVVFEGNLLRHEPDVLVVSSRVLGGEWNGSGSVKDAVSRLIDQQMSDTAIVNVQCKTNWNDNAQIIMLWNALYAQARSGQPMVGGFTIGHNYKSLRELKFFAYAFATVPTNSPDEYQAGHVPVLRVKGISGGNYWGRPSKPGVCASLGMFANNAFSKHAEAFPPISDVGRFAAERLATSGWGDALLAPFRMERV